MLVYSSMSISQVLYSATRKDASLTRPIRSWNTYDLKGERSVSSRGDLCRVLTPAKKGLRTSFDFAGTQLGRDTYQTSISAPEASRSKYFADNSLRLL